jgi:hypothetical protein
MRIKVERYLNYKNELRVGLTPACCYATGYQLNEAEATMLRDDLNAALAGPCIDCASETHMTGSGACPTAHYDDCDD